jgi:group I intron endonuclease
MLIYKITNDVNDKLYIGQTTKTLKERIDGHRNSMVSDVNTHLYNAMRKYGWDKFHFQIIAEVEDQDTLNELEAYYIAKYDTIRNGYNMAPGGSINTMYSVIVKEKHDNIMRSEDVRKRISESMKQSYKDRGGPSKEHKKHLSDSRKALYASEKGQEVRAKFRKSFKLSEAHYKALNDSKNKCVYCIDTQGSFVAEFERVKDAANWWYANGYGTVKSSDQLNDKIKESAKFDKYIKGLKWVYRV